MKGYLLFGFIIWVSVILFGFLCKYLYNYFAKSVGSFYTSDELSKLDKSIYNIYNNYHDIENLIISKFGIFIITTKNYTGYILGKENNNKLTIIDKGKKINVINPIRENYDKCLYISNLLNINMNYINSIVCITSECNVKVSSNKIVYIIKLLKYIKSFNKVVINNVDELNEIIKNTRDN